MKNRSPLITVALALVGLLLVAMGLIALGSKETKAFPSANSFEPSGASAFAELLRRSGYRVEIDTLPVPKLRPGDLAIAFYTTEAGGGLIRTGNPEDKLQPAKDALSKFTTEGGHMISLPLDPDFQGASKKLYTAEEPITNGTFDANVSWERGSRAQRFLDDESEGVNEIFASKDEDPTGSSTNADVFLAERKVGKGTDALFSEGILATNRFIDREENAAVLMNAVGMYSSPGHRVVFVEATFGNSENPALTETIGPWAKAAWMQLVFLAIVIIYTLGKPFGLPNPERSKERGSRELLDAMADTLKRGRMTKLALKILYEDSNRQLRKKFRGPVDLTPANPEAGKIAELQATLIRVKAAIDLGAPEDAATKLYAKTEELTQEVVSRGSRVP